MRGIKVRVFTTTVCMMTMVACSNPEDETALPAPPVDVDALTAEARAAIKDFGPTLKHELQSAMSTGGPVDAIQVCNLRAPEIAAATGVRHDLQIGRTSHKVRNPANAPDEWEAIRLQDFLNAVEQGAAPQTLDYGAVVRTDEGVVFRYMAAIPTAGLCLVCHGQELAPEISEALDALYPKDQARGFEVGDLRGAFTVTRKLD